MVLLYFVTMLLFGSIMGYCEACANSIAPIANFDAFFKYGDKTIKYCKSRIYDIHRKVEPSFHYVTGGLVSVSWFFYGFRDLDFTLFASIVLSVVGIGIGIIMPEIIKPIIKNEHILMCKDVICTLESDRKLTEEEIQNVWLNALTASEGILGIYTRLKYIAAFLLFCSFGLSVCIAV